MSRRAGCLGCHAIHRPAEQGKLMAEKSEAETCLRCHAKRAQKRCSSARGTCFPGRTRGVSNAVLRLSQTRHGSQTEKLISANSINDKMLLLSRRSGVRSYGSIPRAGELHELHSAHGSNNRSAAHIAPPPALSELHIHSCHQNHPDGPNAPCLSVQFAVARYCT